MTVDGRATVLATLTEAQFQRHVVAWAERAGWRCYHTADSRRSAGGFPDLVLIKPRERVIYAELKTIKGRISPQQKIWIDELNQCFGVVVCVWRPDMEDEIKRILRLTSVEGRQDKTEAGSTE